MRRLVGRDDELGALVASVSHVGLTAVIGSAGVGKTALIRAALAELPHLEGGALQSLMHRPFLPLERALGRALSGTDDEVAELVAIATGDAILFIDDVHWADERCIAVLDLVRSTCHVLVASRPEGVSDAAARFLASGRTVSISPLDRLDAVRLARQMHPELSSHELEKLVDFAGGSPLLLDLLVDECESSPTLLAALVARVERLGRSTADALTRLALVGRPIEPDRVGLDGDVAGLVRRLGSLVELRHALLAEALIELGDESRLRVLHAELAAELAGAEAARHFLLADQPARALSAARRALDTAADTAACAEVALLVAVAADRAGVGDCRLWLDAASALVDAGRYDEATDAAAHASIDAGRQAEALFVQGRARWFAGDVDRAIELFDSALQLVDEGTPLSVRVLVERAYLEVRDRRPGGVQAATRALAVARGHGIEEVRARAVLGTTLLYGGNPEWETMLTDAIDDARRAGDVELECTAAFHLVSGLGLVGRRRESIDVATRHVSIAEAAGLRTWRAHFLSALVLNRMLASEDPERTASIAGQLLEEHPLFRNRFQAEASLVFAIADLDRLDEAAVLAQIQWDRATSDEARLFAGLSLLEVAWLRGDDHTVIELASALRPLGDAWFGIRVVCEYAGACAALQVGMDFEPLLTSFALPAVWAGLHELDGVRRWCEGDTVSALDEFDRATRAWLDVDSPRWAIRSEAMAAVLARRAHRSDAVARWQAVHDHASRVGLAHHLRRWGPTAGGLTPRELEVLQLVAVGRTSAQIAAALAITSGTVDDHVESACRKLGVSTRREAAQKVASS